MDKLKQYSCKRRTMHRLRIRKAGGWGRRGRGPGTPRSGSTRSIRPPRSRRIPSVPTFFWRVLSYAINLEAPPKPPWLIGRQQLRSEQVITTKDKGFHTNIIIPLASCLARTLITWPSCKGSLQLCSERRLRSLSCAGERSSAAHTRRHVPEKISVISVSMFCCSWEA